MELMDERAILPLCLRGESYRVAANALLFGRTLPGVAVVSAGSASRARFLTTFLGVCVPLCSPFFTTSFPSPAFVFDRVVRVSLRFQTLRYLPLRAKGECGWRSHARGALARGRDVGSNTEASAASQEASKVEGRVGCPCSAGGGGVGVFESAMFHGRRDEATPGVEM